MRGQEVIGLTENAGRDADGQRLDNGGRCM